MKIRAAVLEQFGEPLAVTDVDLAEPSAGEVLVQLGEACGVCHTDMYTASGADPSGYAPTVLGHEGAGVVERVGSGCHQRRAGRPGGDALLSPVSGVHPLPGSAHQPVSGDSRPAESRLFARWYDAPVVEVASRSVISWARARSLKFTVMPEIALARVSPEAEPDRACLFACGLSTGLGAAMNTAQVKPGSTCVVFGAGMVGLGAVAGCRLKTRRSGSSASISPRSAWSWPGVRAPPRAWTGGEGDRERALEETGGFGADYTFEATGLVQIMRQAVEAARMGWGSVHR